MPGLAGLEVPDHVEALGGRLEIRVGKRRPVRDGEIRPRYLDHDDTHQRIPGGDFGGGEVAGCDVVVVPEVQHDHLAAREQLPDLGREDAEVGAGVGGGLGARVAGENVQDADAERAVLVLLAPDPGREVHERGECAVAAGHGPDAAVHVGVEGGALPDKPDGGGRVPRLLDGRLEAGSGLVRQRVVVAGERAFFDVDRIGKVGGHGDEAVVGDVVRPLQDLGDRAAGTGNFAGRLEQLDADLRGLAVQRRRDRLRFDGEGVDA